MGLLRSNPQSGLDVPSIKLDVCVHSHRCIYPAVFSGYCVDMVTLAVLNLLVPLSESEVAQSCLTLCSPMDCSLRDSPWGPVKNAGSWTPPCRITVSGDGGPQSSVFPGSPRGFSTRPHLRPLKLNIAGRGSRGPATLCGLK